MQAELFTNGMASGPATSLIPLPLLDELNVHVQKLHAPLPSAMKPYLIQWLGRWPVYAPQSIWGRIAAVLEPLAQAYLHAPTQLAYYNLWQSLVCTAPPASSQLWHRDTEDRSMLKAFLYLSDVTADAGPLHYIPNTHWRGTRKVRPATMLEPFGTVQIERVLDPNMEAVVARSDWRLATGPKGTLVLADTTGWHKGGYATGQERLVAVWHWVTTKCPHGTRFARKRP